MRDVATAPTQANYMAALRGVSLLAAVPDAELERVAARVSPVELLAGAVLMREGDSGDCCYVIVRGELAVLGQDLIGLQKPLATCGPGALLGEIVLVEQGRRTATVQARTDALALALNRADFQDLETVCPAFSVTVRHHVEQLLLDGFLRRASVFAHLPLSNVREVMDAAQPLHVAAGTVVLREGEPGTTLYLVRGGRLEVLRHGKRLQVLEVGDYFGEVALLAAIPRTATVRALEETDLLALDKDVVDALLATAPSVRQHLLEMARLRVGSLPGQPGSPELHPDALSLSAAARHAWWWRLLLAGGCIFALASLLVAHSGNSALAYATVLLGALLGPVTYVVFLAEAQVLRQRPGTLVLTFLIGAAVCAPLAVNIEQRAGLQPDGLGSAALIAFIEEGVKLLAVLWLLGRARARFSLDGVIYGAAAGMGFAALETALYGLNRLDVLSSLLTTVWYRTVLSPFGHGTWTALICAALWQAKGSRRPRVTVGVVLAFAAAVSLHTLWDWPLITSNLNLVWRLAVGAIGLVLLAMVVRRATQEEAAAVLALNPDLVSLAAQAKASELSPLACASCGQVSPSGTRYCPRCGAALRRA